MVEPGRVPRKGRIRAISGKLSGRVSKNGRMSVRKKKKGFFKFGLILNNFMGTILLFFLNVVHLQSLRNDNFWG